VAALLVALCVAGGAAAAVSPESLVDSAISAMRAQQSYHYVDRGVPLSGAVRVTMVGDATHTTGIQRITYSKGSRRGHVTVVVVANTAYIRGDAFTLKNYMLFSASQAASYSGKWLKLAHTASGFPTVAADVRLDRSALGALKMPSSVRSLGRSVARGQQVTGLRATIHHAGLTGIETLYVRATGALLPVEQTLTVDRKLVSDVVYSGWGERVNISVPAAALSLP
jgi:hypothetical protein